MTWNFWPLIGMSVWSLAAAVNLGAGVVLLWRSWRRRGGWPDFFFALTMLVMSLIIAAVSILRVHCPWCGA